MNKQSNSFRNGFAKGIDICKSNLRTEGYDADTINRRTMNACMRYADTGYKHDFKLNENKIDFYYGMAEGIAYYYKSHGTPLNDKQPLSKFEQYEQNHYYGEDKHYENIDDEVFG